MLATLTADRFSDPRWVFEPKLDGIRCLAFVRRGEVRLLSRNRKELGGAYPEVVAALGAAGRDMILDGEVVALTKGVSSFQLLQQRSGLRGDQASRSRVRVHYYIFDLLHLDGRDLRGLPLTERRALLRDALEAGGPLRLTSQRKGAGEKYYADACRRGLEGVIAKRADARYSAGRSADWLKFKCVSGQEMVIGGWTDPQGSRTGFGALLVGYHDGDRLRYAGKVGTGYDDATLRSLSAKLERLKRAKSPFADAPAMKSVHWVQPTLVAQVGFHEWTSGGLLRQPRFLGLRDDKRAATVVRERPRPV